jgi:hypothetical protein
VSSRGQLAGVTALLGAGVFIAVVGTLHVLQRDYDPAHQLMSELALGPHGGAMIAAFGGLALAMAAIQFAVASQGGSVILRAFLLAAAAFFLAAGIFPLGATSTEHIAAIACAFVTAVLAMYLFPTTAGTAADVAGRSVSWTCAAGVAAGIVLGLSAVPMGVGQRIGALFLLAWMLVVGWRLAHQVARKRSK